jgi:uncharacterized protein (TIGR02300 family)
LQSVAKSELGTKRLCAGCGVKFYDLNKSPIVCPKCATVFEVAPVARARSEAVKAPARETAVETPETQDAEFVSLEEADAEAQGKKKQPADETASDDLDVEVEDDEEGDDAFIEESEEEDTDVSEIIGGDIEDEEES